MNKSKQTFLIFLTTLILGISISTNINLGEIQSFVELNAKQYKDAIEERANLYKEIGNLKENNIEIKDKINDYMKEDEKNDKILEDMKAQILDYELFVGSSQVEGPGIVLKINDASINLEQDSQFEVADKIFHDNDMALVLNELRKAGAEAISVNNHRVSPWTGVICNWAFIGFDDNTMESAPFSIYAIGDPEKLKTALLEDGSHVKELIIRNLYVEIEEKDKITLLPSRATNEIEFMKRYENN
ncbi:DUF881 domain-containing protein [Clostridium botulinum]|uniref:DUF881 domain-containing protein n=1 Tax=Clostridium botulinum (strain Eklund 17B / Type B) TaxID=935198 RepID=B2TS20_CLOBB|nr:MULTISPECIES: DUF881 domain-containing protein [Clostridium]ACD22938.1 conserved hypothetical protein [Clostridium botulinum B str. Eklund 17B (NRP)]AIY81883.1 hypothetical protein U728_1342 [Clostridium botulinum 202F]KAI3346890.1 DUF881 domain-containing protein [Clostridium botulinum]KFX55575.1 division initiation protein [Clostridium botulinum]KFX55737.1 division initiation protein [Clostridium botulinum]